MLNFFSKTDQTVNDLTFSLPIERHKSKRTPLTVDVIYRSNDYLNAYNKARGVWISANQICFKLIAGEQLIVNQILFLRFVAPDENVKQFMKVTIAHIENDKVVADYETA